MVSKTIIDNVSVYRKKDGTQSYYVRVTNRRSGEREQIQVNPPADITGKKLIRWLEEERNNVMKSVNGGAQISDRRMRLDDFFVKVFIPEKERAELGVKTIYDYKKFYNHHISDFMGNMRIGEISRQDVIDFYDYLTFEKQVGNATHIAIHRLLRNILNVAYALQVIDRNVASGPNLAPKKKSKKERFLTLDELIRTLECADREPIAWKVIYHLMINTGCRRGELLALRWEHIDLKNGRIYFEKSISYVPGMELFVKGTKTDSSVREIPIFDDDIELLREYRGDSRNGFVFPGEGGPECPMFPDTVTKHTTDFCKRNNIDHFSPHALRRSMSNVLIESGENAKTVQAILGHASVTTTLSYYAKASDGTIRLAMDRLKKDLSGRL